MIRLLLLIIFLAAGQLRGHIGSPNIVVQSRAGPYPVLVSIRPPEVIPGLAQIAVRVETNGVQKVEVLPVYFKAGRAGAPPPDEAKLVHGETNLYSAELWLMKTGAYSVDIVVHGEAGTGTLAIPVNAMATRTLEMSKPYALTLGFLGTLLLAGAVAIAGFTFRDSLLEPGQKPGKREKIKGWIAATITAVVLGGGTFLGKLWWDLEAADYRNNRLYKPVPVTAEARLEGEQTILRLSVDPQNRRGGWTRLIPDHGKIMHAFVVREPSLDAFAHLHPFSRSQNSFEAALPPVPAGTYRLYADVTHENGFAETLVSSFQSPAPVPLYASLWTNNLGEPICSSGWNAAQASALFLAPDPDDSWHVDNHVIKGPVYSLAGGTKLRWKKGTAPKSGRPHVMEFETLSESGAAQPVEPYMGMHGHLVVRKVDGTVFAHVHPLGNVSMASQSLLGSTNVIHTKHATSGTGPLAVTFPYEFPTRGKYRIWLQLKSAGLVRTGVFEADIE